MADDEKHEYRPERSENILSGESERPELVHTPSSEDVEAEDEAGDLKRTETSRTMARERTFEPIMSGDRAELTRIASNFSSIAGGSLARTPTRGSELQKKDTLYGVEVGDAVLDPRSPEFDPYKWARMYGNSLD
jgi:hypothetical protein